MKISCAKYRVQICKHTIEIVYLFSDPLRKYVNVEGSVLRIIVSQRFVTMSHPVIASKERNGSSFPTTFIALEYEDLAGEVQIGIYYCHLLGILLTTEEKFQYFRELIN